MQLHQTFSALGDPTRFAIVERLLTEGEQTAGSLQSAADISAPAISRHLKVLRTAGVIQRRVDAQRRMYSVRPDMVQAINNWTLDHREFWEISLKRLEAALMSEKERK